MILNEQEILEDNVQLQLSEKSKQLIQKSKNYLDKKLKESEKPLYEINTGFGALCNIKISKDELRLNSGFMIPQYAAASIVSQNKQFYTPASVDSIPSSNEQEDHVSMGANAATKGLKVALNTEKILAIELYNAAQALEFRRPLKTSPFLEQFLKDYRKKVAFVKHDVAMYEGINKSIEFLNETEIRRL